MSTLKTTAIQHLNGSSPNINLDANNNVTVPGTLNVSSGIFASTLSPYIFNKPSPSGYQTVMQVGSSSGGLFLTSDNAIIHKGCYYNNGWVATATHGNMLDFQQGGYISYSYFTGATVGTAPSMTSYNLVHTGSYTSSNSSSGYSKFPNGFIVQWGNFSLGDGGTQNVTFPIAFSSACYAVNITQIYQNGADQYQNGVRCTGFPSTTGVSIRQNTNGTNSFFWTAYGY